MSVVDPSLWEIRRAFGVAGGPDEVALTSAGLALAFAVGAQVRRGTPAKALAALWFSRGDGYLSVRADGARMRRTGLGRFDQVTWGYLRNLGLVVSFQDERGDGVRLTDAGERAVHAGHLEQRSLLDRCRRAHDSTSARRPLGAGENA